ncbi:MAG: aspartate-semialdehyde dehydrogenase [Spirochaetales bacterium]|nr:aspartate-semialdehyde dehydrogenase [Spirochaetales bacterium]
MDKKIPVAVLGATGTVGQKFITLLENHPWFTVSELVASPRSAGKTYEEACAWKQDKPIPTEIAKKTVLAAGESLESRILFSGMDASVAGPIEEDYANAGHFVVSNAKNHRTDSDVPIIIPEVNADHFEIIKKQPYKGAIVTNSNCVVMPLAMVLSPLDKAFGVEWVQLTTLQAISGAGYPGVASYDILGNVVPFIGGEEPKVECEAQKIMGRLENDHIVDADFVVSAQCTRVPVVDGHTETASIKFKKKPTPDQVKEILRNWKSMPQEKKLPSAPENPVIVFEEENRPQPARDIWLQGGMAACVGRVRECPIGDIKMVIMGHNTVRGAAGAAILNAEAFVALGYLD